MECKRCGAWAPPDPDTGYDADDVCPRCAPLEEAYTICEDYLDVIGQFDEALISIEASLTAQHKPDPSLLKLLDEGAKALKGVHGVITRVDAR